MKQKENRGGARPNTGPKLKYGEKTKRITLVVRYQWKQNSLYTLKIN